MAIRRSALERVGPFDVSLEHGGDEQEWQERLRAWRAPTGLGADGVLYVAAAAVEHRRAGADARLRSLAPRRPTRAGGRPAASTSATRQGALARSAS